MLGVNLGLALPAHAQLSGAVGIQSDYRFRGISLSEGQPVATLDLSYDHASGFYAGGSAIAVNEDGPRALGFIEYAGFATPRIGRVSLDFGVDNQNLSGYAARRYQLNYSEIYAGVAGSHLSAHVYYSPNYFRWGVQTLYADVEASMKPADNWRLFGHLGATAPLGRIAGRRQRYDLRVGVARQFGPLELQASVTGTSPAPPAGSPPERAALVLGASWYF
jgi:uncharacterized protein (TIGR02001 family)